MSRHLRAEFERWMATTVLMAVCSVASTADSVLADPTHAEHEAHIAEKIENDPSDSAPHLRRARLRASLGEWDAAAASYIVAAELGADRDVTDAGLASIYLEKDMPLAAEALAKTVLTRHDGHVGARLTVARARGALGDAGAAAEQYRLAVATLDRPSPDLVLEAFRAQLAADRPTAALSVADTAMEKIGIVASIQVPAIEVERQLGRTRAALVRVDALLVQAPRHEVWIAERGDLLAELGRHDEAREAYERALILLGDRPAGRRSDRLVELEDRLRNKLAEGGGKETGS